MEKSGEKGPSHPDGLVSGGGLACTRERQKSHAPVWGTNDLPDRVDTPVTLA